MRVLTICFFINLFVCVHAKSQQFLTALSSAKKQVGYNAIWKPGNTVTPAKDSFSIKSYNPPLKPLPASFYFNSIGFFCQKELQLEKVIKFPVKFRLGSVAYTDQMEGKGNGRH